jgi:hypothetical protein
MVFVEPLFILPFPKRNYPYCTLDLRHSPYLLCHRFKFTVDDLHKTSDVNHVL